MLESQKEQTVHWLTNYRGKIERKIPSRKMNKEMNICENIVMENWVKDVIRK